MTNQPALSDPSAPSGEHPGAATRGRDAAVTPKRSSNPGAPDGQNPKNRKAGPG